jgi:hypothetical protein
MSESVIQVWEQLETVLKGTFSESERTAWLDLVLLYTDGKCSWDVLESTIRGARRAYGQSHGTGEPRGPMQSASHERGATRTEILTEILAAHATNDQQVTQFRKEVLEGTLLIWSDIKEWIMKEHEKERELPKGLLDGVPLPPGHHVRSGRRGELVPDPPVCIGEAHPAWHYRVETLDYAIPDDPWVHCIPVAHSGILGRLHRLSTQLAQKYRWQPAQATVFVLTGLIPVVQSINHKWDFAVFQTDTGSVTALSRIVLTIDPTLSPKEVHHYFQSIRQSSLGAKWRDLRDRQFELARFALHHGGEESLPQRMMSWNENFPQWNFDNPGNFKRDCHDAIEKLLAPISSEPRDMLMNFFSQSEGRHAETSRES